MSKIVSISERKKQNFKQFLSDNKDKIRATTPRVESISVDDEWASETEWDELFYELTAKEN